MAWTTPKTWASGYVVLAADLNTHLRDNLNVTAPAVMTTAGDIIYASGANTPARLAKSTTSTQYLANTGTSNIPAWNEVALATGVSGTLPVGNGGTGATTLTANGALIGNGTSAIASVDMSTKGGLLAGDGSGNPSVLAIGGSNDHVLTIDSGETTGMKWAAVSAGAGPNLVEIGSVTASSSASLTVTGLSDTYEMYLITLANMEPETDNVNAYLRIGDSSGVDSGASDYTWNDQKTTTGATGATGSFDASDSQIVIGSTIGNNSERVFNATIWMGRDPGAAARTVCHGASSSYNATSGDTEGMTIMGGRKAAIDMDRINFLFSSGDIATGEMTVYGLKFS